MSVVTDDHRELVRCRVEVAQKELNEALDYAYTIGLRSRVSTTEGHHPKVQVTLMKPVELKVKTCD